VILAETNDLIYEGIATVAALWIHTPSIETNDLIYEGIATYDDIAIFFFYCRETNDLIYEGIATVFAVECSFFNGLRNKRPDLRRDCDRNQSHNNQFHSPQKQTT